MGQSIWYFTTNILRTIWAYQVISHNAISGYQYIYKMEHPRRRPVYRNRINPLIYFDEIDFIARYRLPKDIVRELAQRFARSPYISTLGDPRGRGLHPEERVGIRDGVGYKLTL